MQNSTGQGLVKKHTNTMYGGGMINAPNQPKNYYLNTQQPQ